MDGKEIEKLFGNKKEKVKEEISKIYKKIAEDLQNSSWHTNKENYNWRNI